MPEETELDRGGLSGLLKLALDDLPDGISIHAPTGELLFANKKVLQLYALEGSDFAGRGCGQIFHGEGSTCAHEEVVATGRPVEIENAVTCGDRVYGLSIRPLLDGQGAVAGFVRLIRDVSGERRSQEQLLKAEQFATLGQMINGIAHDIGTPLNIISGYCEYLMMRTRPDEAGYTELATILQQTKRIAEFIRQMLDLARPAQDRADAIEVKGFLQDSLDLISHHLRKADVRATLVSKTSPPLIYGDAPRLRQAFFNLLLNACQKAGAGGRMELVLDREEQSPDYLAVSIEAADSAGKGLDFSELFSEFLARGERREAVGLGLSLAREIFDRFGATIAAKETGGPGVSLVVYLPLNSRGQSVARTSKQ